MAAAYAISPWVMAVPISPIASIPAIKPVADDAKATLPNASTNPTICVSIKRRRSI